MSNNENNRRDENSTFKLVLLLSVLAVIVAVALFFVWRSEETQYEPMTLGGEGNNPQVSANPDFPPVVSGPAKVESADPDVSEAPPESLEEPTPEEPLPRLEASDPVVIEDLEAVAGETRLTDLLVTEELVRKFVRAVNAMEEGKLVHQHRPLVSPQDPFGVEEVDGESNAKDKDTEDAKQYRLSPENFRRYESYVNALAQLEPETLVAVYRRYYPLLEEAYNELGVDKGSFHDVMVGAIDELLAAPDSQGELALSRPGVTYKFSDPAMEKLPATHKLMLRIGPENNRKLKQSLLELRQQLAEEDGLSR